MSVDAKRLLLRPMVPKLICLLLVCLLMGQVIFGLIPIFSLDKDVPIRHDQQVILNGQISNVERASLQTPLFGEYLPKSLGDGEVRQSMLQLTIVGIMYSDNEQISHVIVQSASGREQLYRVGDQLPGGVVLKRITPDGILVIQNGVLESISFKKNMLMFESEAKPLKNSEM
jgi:general secretion pathway protein C